MRSDALREALREAQRRGFLDLQGLTLDVTFVPYSRASAASRRLGRYVMTTPLSTGIGYCPSHQGGFWEQRSVAEDVAIRHEVETGRSHKDNTPIKPPDPLRVWACLLGDVDALDHPTFEAWCADSGHNTDSIQAKALYQDSLETDLQLRAALGDGLLAVLRKLFNA